MVAALVLGLQACPQVLVEQLDVSGVLAIELVLFVVGVHFGLLSALVSDSDPLAPDLVHELESGRRVQLEIMEWLVLHQVRLEPALFALKHHLRGLLSNHLHELRGIDIERSEGGRQHREPVLLLLVGLGHGAHLDEHSVWRDRQHFILPLDLDPHPPVRSNAHPALLTIMRDRVQPKS